MAATTHKVLNSYDAQPVPDQPIEWWTDPSGRKWRRMSLGDVAAGNLILGGIGSGVDLLWRGRNSPRRSLFSDSLDAALQDAWETMTRKSGPRQPHRIAGYVGSGDISTWWLGRLPLPYPQVRPPFIVESRLGGGAELFRILPPRIRRPKG